MDAMESWRAVVVELIQRSGSFLDENSGFLVPISKKIEEDTSLSRDEQGLKFHFPSSYPVTSSYIHILVAEVIIPVGQKQPILNCAKPDMSGASRASLEVGHLLPAAGGSLWSKSLCPRIPRGIPHTGHRSNGFEPLELRPSPERHGDTTDCVWISLTVLIP